MSAGDVKHDYHLVNPSPWPLVGSRCHGNVHLLQGTGDCVPCLLEGCDRHVGSFSRCLQELPVSRVLAAARDLLQA